MVLHWAGAVSGVGGFITRAGDYTASGLGFPVVVYCSVCV